MGFTWLTIKNAHILNLSKLPHFEDHKDPFNRLLVAQAMTEPLILLTVDNKLSRYGEMVKVV
jgi:PIN domain nuclease of toxin-antitoxin system